MAGVGVVAAGVVFLAAVALAVLPFWGVWVVDFLSVSLAAGAVLPFAFAGADRDGWLGCAARLEDWVAGSAVAAWRLRAEAPGAVKTNCPWMGAPLGLFWGSFWDAA